jgi:hypothetical protein
MGGIGGRVRLSSSARSGSSSNFSEQIKGTVSREEHKTNHCGLRISGMALSNQRELPAFFSPRQVDLKISHRILPNPTIPHFTRMAKSRKMTYRDWPKFRLTTRRNLKRGFDDVDILKSFNNHLNFFILTYIVKNVSYFVALIVMVAYCKIIFPRINIYSSFVIKIYQSRHQRCHSPIVLVLKASCFLLVLKNHFALLLLRRNNIIFF